jgi:hypothetical protein
MFYPRTLTESELRDPVSARAKLQKLCWQCDKHPARAVAVHFSDVPACLQKLSPTVQFSLAIISVHQGQPAKHPSGYRRKDRMTGLSWKAVSVSDGIEALDGAEKYSALAARVWLLANNEVGTCKQKGI